MSIKATAFPTGEPVPVIIYVRELPDGKVISESAFPPVSKSILPFGINPVTTALEGDAVKVTFVRFAGN